MSVPDIFDRYLAEESQIELDVPAQDRARFHLVVRDCALSWKRHPKASFHILRGKHLFALQFQGPVEGKTVTLFTFRSAVETGEYRFHGIQLDKLPAGLTPQGRSNLERIKELYEAALPGHMQHEGAIVIPVKKSPSIDFLPIVDEARRVVDDGQQEFEPIDESARLVIPAERAADLVAKSAPLPEPKVKPAKAAEPPAAATAAPAASPAPKPPAKPVSKPKKASKSKGPNVSVDDLILTRPIDPRATVVFDANNWPKVVAPAAPKTVAKTPAKASAKAPPESEAKALSTSRLPQSAPTPAKTVDLSKWLNRPLKLVQTDEKPAPKPANAKGGKAVAKGAPAKVDPKAAAKAAPAPVKGGKPVAPAKGAPPAKVDPKAAAKAAPAKVDPKAATTAAPAKGVKPAAPVKGAPAKADPKASAKVAAAPAKVEAKGAKPASGKAAPVKGAPAKADSKAATKALPKADPKAAKPASAPAKSAKPTSGKAAPVKAAAKPSTPAKGAKPAPAKAAKAAPAKGAKAAPVKAAAKPTPKPAAKAKPAAKSKKR